MTKITEDEIIQPFLMDLSSKLQARGINNQVLSRATMLLFLPEDKEQSLSTGIKVTFGDFYESNGGATLFTDLDLAGYRDLIRFEEDNQGSFANFFSRINEYFELERKERLKIKERRERSNGINELGTGKGSHVLGFTVDEDLREIKPSCDLSTKEKVVESSDLSEKKLLRNGIGGEMGSSESILSNLIGSMKKK